MITKVISSLLNESKNRSLSTQCLTVFIAVGVMFFLLYYMLIERKTWQNATLRYLPLKKKNIKAIGKESIDLVKSNALAIPLVAIMQGIVALIGYYIFGVDNPFFWFGVTVIGSMIPLSLNASYCSSFFMLGLPTFFEQSI